MDTKGNYKSLIKRIFYVKQICFRTLSPQNQHFKSKMKRRNKEQGEEWHGEDWERNSTFYLSLGIFPLLPAGFFATRQSQFA